MLHKKVVVWVRVHKALLKPLLNKRRKLQLRRLQQLQRHQHQHQQCVVVVWLGTLKAALQLLHQLHQLKNLGNPMLNVWRAYKKERLNVKLE
jgi:hypothetical protein